MVAGGPESAAPASAGAEVGAPLPASARALLRWLPSSEPSGAFAGQHDKVHCSQQEVHARTNLWWSDGVVHPGSRVGPPRGGLVPNAHATYSVALPAGGYLVVEDGVLAGWHARSPRQLPLVRADGQHFETGRYSVVQPYFRRHYERMSPSAVRAALAGLGGAPKPGDVDRVLGIIAGSEDPVVCSCTGRAPTAQGRTLSLVVPESLLVDAGTLRILVGDGDTAEATATLWRLSGMVWDPVRVGRAMAAEAVARDSGESARGWPQAPITEQAVAHIAAQAVRYHGAALVRTMPAWLLGWVMVAGPVLGAVEPDRGALAAGLDTADRVRVARVETQWHAMAAARLLISRSSSVLHALEDPGVLLQSDPAPVMDLRQQSITRPDRADEEAAAGLPVRDAVRLAYRTDAASWFGAIADLHR